MKQRSVSFRKRLHALLETVITRLGWLPSTLTLLLAAAAAVLLSTIGDLSGGDQVLRFWLGLTCALVNVLTSLAIDWWRRSVETAGSQEVAQYSITLSNAIQPMAERIASMPMPDSRARKRSADKVLGLAVSSLQLLLRDVENIRVVVYILNSRQDSLEVEYNAGRRDKPRPFKLGDGGRGDAAFNMITQGSDALYIADVEAGQTEGWKGSGSGYATFITAPIRADTHAYGMLTVDAPNPGDLSENDKPILVVLATLLAIALAEAER